MIVWDKNKIEYAISVYDDQRAIDDAGAWSRSAQELSSHWKTSISSEQLRSAVRRYRRQIGRNAVEINNTPSVEREVVIGLLGDTHLCSNYERIDMLNDLYDRFSRAGVCSVFHTGNYIDGESKYNMHDVHVHGLDNQAAYFVRTYPQREGITTYYIDGDDHEGWYTQREGIVIGEYVESKAIREGRNDLVYLGYMERDVYIDRENRAGILRVLHPGGGSAYSLSYTGQKIIDGYRSEELPQILAYGHYHKASFVPNYRGVWLIQTATTQEQTPFMRKKRLVCDLGGWICRVAFADKNIISISAEYISYPMSQWSYKTNIF